MKLKTTIYYPLFFSFCILASLVASSYLNINTTVSNSNFSYSKHTSFAHKEKTSTANDFLFEENETESETSLDFKVWTSLLSDLLSYFQSVSNNKELYASHLSIEEQTSPIYILVCNFRL